jgi:hypothetical protein
VPGTLALVCLWLAGCTEPELRSFNFFMEDKIAREGTILRCDAAPEESQNDIECANARRADATIALELERARIAELERESERRIQELSRRIDERERLAREAALEAVRAERERYEELWRAAQEAGTAAATEAAAPAGAAASESATTAGSDPAAPAATGSTATVEGSAGPD